MSTETLLASAAFALASGTLFLLVGRRVSGRELEGEAALAGQAFATWWYALAAATLYGGFQTGLAALGLTNVALHVAGTYLNLLLICLALWGLLYYLIYLFTGRSSWLLPLTFAYILYYFSLVYYVSAADPTGLVVDEWSVTIEYAHPIEGPVVAVLLALLVVPQIVAALAYFTTMFRLEDRSQRFRVCVVSWAIVMWFSTALVGAATGLSDAAWWPLASRLIGLLAAASVLVAFDPPVWVQRRLAVRPYAGGTG